LFECCHPDRPIPLTWPHTDGSIVFARLHQRAPTSSTPKSASVPHRCCPLLNRFQYIDRQICPGISCAGSSSKLSLHARGSGPHLTRYPLANRFNIPNGISIGSAAFAGPTAVTETNRSTDHITPSVTIGRIASAAAYIN